MKKKPKSGLQIYQSIRKTWDCKPVTKIIPNKKAYSRKAKHKDESFNDNSLKELWFEYLTFVKSYDIIKL